ncbi:MAG: hypothetical protein DMF82_13530 [Acidobacteria bacterium]|nr:MAG: hypothetical protein DMF82_13530 [Acidobacteriota bacterium]
MPATYGRLPSSAMPHALSPELVPNWRHQASVPLLSYRQMKASPPPGSPTPSMLPYVEPATYAPPASAATPLAYS